MHRQKLLDTLMMIRPALASNDLVPILTHAWFEGGRVLACNDAIAISAPCEVGFTGAVPGATLLSVLQASRSKEVEFIPGEQEVQVRAGGARLKLPLLPIEKFPFDMPEPAKAAETLPVSSAEFVTAIESCLRSVSKDTSVADQLGVTVVPGKKNLLLYATNGVTISYVPVVFKGKVDWSLTQRVVLPTLFCEQLVRLGRQDKSAKLVVAGDYALLSTAGGVHLYGKLVEIEHPLDFTEQIREVMPEDEAQRAVGVPAGLARVVERALIIADPTGERVCTQITVKDGVASFVTKSGRGEMRDKLKLEGHPDVSMSVDAQWVKIGCGFEKILLTEGAAILRKGRELYLVASHG